MRLLGHSILKKEALLKTFLHSINEWHKVLFHETNSGDDNDDYDDDHKDDDDDDDHRDDDDDDDHKDDR